MKTRHASFLAIFICSVLSITNIVKGQSSFPTSGFIGTPVTFTMGVNCIVSGHVIAYWDFGSGANPPQATATSSVIVDSTCKDNIIGGFVSFSQGVTYTTTGDKTVTLRIAMPGGYSSKGTFPLHIYESTESVKNDLNSVSITLSPNPTNGILRVKGLPSDNITVSVFNLFGEMVMVQKNPSSPNLTLDLSKFVPGIYYIRFSSANSVVTRMVVRE